MLGRTLSHYRILEKIGSGGMGDVYLAEDTKLDRKVALKVLPPELAENEERRARFQREAKAIAALNHPNIVHVYSVEEADGVHFITMELVKGKTLSELIPKKGFQLDKFFEIATPLADAVASAHEAGIVHRDLKPGNVMVADDGRVKVLDFGLAHGEPLIAANVNSESPTELKTREGMLAGTLHYMSPEQAEGKSVDHRSDIFSLGVIYYEMLTGARPFDAATPATFVSQLVRDTPPAVSELNPNVPPELARIVRRCLAKPLDKRLQSAVDLRNELQETSEIEDTATPTVARTDRGALLGAGLVIGAAMAAVVFWIFGSRDVATEASSPTLVNPRQVTFDVDVEDYPTWSPDGRTLAYHSNRDGNWDIWIVQAGGGDPLNRTAEYDGSDRFPSWSPDGEQIAFVSSRDGGGLFLMSPLAGEPRKVGPAAGGSPNIVWSKDSRRIGYRMKDPPGTQFFEIVTLETGESTRIPIDAGDIDIYDLSWSADERLLAFIEGSSRDNDVTRVRIVDLVTGLSHPVTDGQSKAWSTSFCHNLPCLYYVANRTGIMDLWRQSLAEDGTPVGEPCAVTVGVGMRSASFSAPGDKLAYSKGARVSNIWRVPILPDRPATWDDAEQLTAEQAHIESVDVSRDGTMVLFDSNRAGGRDIWVLRLDKGTSTRLTTHPAPDWGPILSPDGTEIAFYSKRGPSRDVWVIPIEGGAPRQITDDEAQDNVFAWSPDGQQLAFASTRSGSWDVWIVDKDGGGALKLADKGYTMGWSPDGSWLAFAEAGNPQADGIWMVPARGGEPRQLSNEEGWAPRWSGDGKTVFFIATDRSELWAVNVDTGAERAMTALSSRDGEPGNYALATDGSYLYFTWEHNSGDIWVMDVVQ